MLVMRHTLLYFSLVLGLAVWSVPASYAQGMNSRTPNVKKLSRAEKKALKKQGKEVEEDKDKEKKKADKRALAKAMKDVETFMGKVKAAGKFFMIVGSTTDTEEGENTIKKLAEIEPELKKGRVSLLLVDTGMAEEKDKEKAYKKLKAKLPVTADTKQLEDLEIPVPSTGTILFCDVSGKQLASGGSELLDGWHKYAGVKPAPVKKKKVEKEDTEAAAEEEE